MNIKHYPIFNTEEICKHYAEKDGVPVTYVCTTDLKASDSPADVFYRDMPHPEFGNKYFGLFYDNYRDCVMICDADIVETFEFGVVENDTGELEYSQSHHDYKHFENGNMIDGGRQYIKSSHGAVAMCLKDGKFYPKEVHDLVRHYEKTKQSNKEYYPGNDCQV